MKTLNLAILPALLMCCSGEDPFREKPVPEGNVNLGNLIYGQKSLYIGYSAVCGLSDVNFTGDTLLLETVMFNNQMHLKESYTPGSPAFTGGYRLFEINKISDDVVIPEREGSALLFFYGNDTIHLKPTQQVDLVQSECRMLLGGNNFTGDEIGFIKDFRLGTIRQTDKTVVSCVPMFYMMDAYLIYDQNYLYMSHTIINGADQTRVGGWKLVTP